MITYKQYLKKIKIKKLFILLSQISILIIIILLWQFLSDKNYINSFITSNPKSIIKTLITLYKQNNLTNHIFITVKETIISFSITTILSLIISVIFYNYKTLSKIIDPYLIVLNSLPKVALGPIIIIWCGANTKSIITMSVLISIIVSIQNVYTSFEETDKNKIQLLKMFNASKFDILYYLVIPSNKKAILNTLKVNISLCLIGVVTGEFLTSKAGIGYLILYGSQIFNLNLVMSGIVLLMIISVLMYEIITFISK